MTTTPTIAPQPGVTTATPAKRNPLRYPTTSLNPYAEVSPSVHPLTVVRGWAGALLERFAAWCRDFFGTVEIVTDGRFCAVCNDVHREAERCPREMIGVCLDCGDRWRPLDRYGNCSRCGSSSVSQRRLRNARRIK